MRAWKDADRPERPRTAGSTSRCRQGPTHIYSRCARRRAEPHPRQVAVHADLLLVQNQLTPPQPLQFPSAAATSFTSGISEVFGRPPCIDFVAPLDEDAVRAEHHSRLLHHAAPRPAVLSYRASEPALEPDPASLAWGVHASGVIVPKGH